MRHDTRHHTADDGTVSSAVFSTCGTYRYALTRRWAEGHLLAFVMLNPSRADERANDPTIARCEKRARMWGYGGVDIVNLFAFRATDPADLKAADAPVGPDNATFVREAVARAGVTLAAWGVHGRHRDQDRVALGWIGAAPLHVLGLTRHGLPRHPLYISYAARPVAWAAPRPAEEANR